MFLFFADDKVIKESVNGGEKESRECPNCHNKKRIWKDGLRETSNGLTQRYLCPKCGYRFSKSSYNQLLSNRSYQLCVLEAKKLDSTAKTKIVVGEKQIEDKGKLVWFSWQMKKQNYNNSTIKTYTGCIKNLLKRKADLSNPDNIKETLVRWECGTSHKHNVAAAYSLFLEFQNQTWKAPKFQVKQKIRYFPKESELDALIAGTGKKTSTFLQTLKETAMRSGECSKLKWEDVDIQRKTIILNETEKNGTPRIFKISQKLANMISRLPKKTEYVFGSSSKTCRSANYYTQRKKIAHKLGNPNLLKIGLHDFRRWKATMLYHETKNDILVMRFLGHKNLNTTQLYVRTEESLFTNETQNFQVKATADQKEIQSLLEVGFEFVCQKGELMFFRKRK